MKSHFKFYHEEVFVFTISKQWPSWMKGWSVRYNFERQLRLVLNWHRRKFS